MTLETELKKRAAQWAKEITTKANENLGDKLKLIKVRSTTTDTSAGVVSIEVNASNKDSNKNVAHAYEYGSGIHGRRHTTYRIAPRNASVLAFYWQPLLKYPAGTTFKNPMKLIAVPETGVGLFNFVDHPGVAALKNGRGYMKPAIDSVRKKINKELREMTPEEIRASIRRSFAKA